MFHRDSQLPSEDVEMTTTGLTRSILEDTGITETERLPIPSWQARGSCWRTGYDLFFPDNKDDARSKIPKAKKICEECPVRKECLQYALETESQHGVWGGTTRSERKRISKELEETGIAPKEWVANERT